MATISTTIRIYAGLLPGSPETYAKLLTLSEQKTLENHLMGTLSGFEEPKIDPASWPSFNPVLDIASEGLPGWDKIRAALHTALDAYNKETSVYHVQFQIEGSDGGSWFEEEEPSSVKYIVDDEGEVKTFFNWKLSVVEGRYQGEHEYNLFPLAEAVGSEGFALPVHLSFLLAADGDPVYDLEYYMVMSFTPLEQSAPETKK